MDHQTRNEFEHSLTRTLTQAPQDQSDSLGGADFTYSTSAGEPLAAADVAELNEFCEGVQAGFWVAGTAIKVWISMDPSRFLLDYERSLAWGIQPDMPVCFELYFDKFYINSR